MTEINDYEFITDKQRKLKLEILSKIKKKIILKCLKLNINY